MLAAWATAIRRWFTDAPGRIGRVLLRANTGPVDGLIFAYAVAWAVYLILTPDKGFAAAHATLLAVKWLWVWPALIAVLLTPLGWVCHWRWLHHLARGYAVVWWLFLCMATLILLPSVIVFWLPALSSAGAAFWLAVRVAADEIIRDQQTG
jgi:hypothetical protein